MPPDSVAQFQVVTNNGSAEYGRASGATINVASQSGTNNFHATLYEFIRNTDLNAEGFFHPTVIGTNGPVPFQKPTLDRNQYGFNFGGPILKNKLFFFLDYEGFRQTLKPLYVLTVPTQNELQRDSRSRCGESLTGSGDPEGNGGLHGDPILFPAQVVSYFQRIKGLPVSGSATTGQAASDYSVQIPFTDHSDKGDLRFDFGRLIPTARRFCASAIARRMA